MSSRLSDAMPLTPAPTPPPQLTNPGPETGVCDTFLLLLIANLRCQMIQHIVLIIHFLSVRK
jgi:hypothetical protein